MNLRLTAGGHIFVPLQIWTYGKAVIQFGSCAKPPFDVEVKRREWLGRLNGGGFKLPENSIYKYPSVPLADFLDTNKLKEFLSAMTWFVQQLQLQQEPFPSAEAVLEV